jgi:hypothetical protein
VSHEPRPLALDIIGDIHGNLPALLALGRSLGYAVERGWDHPDGRLPVFLGDLVDRGPYSLGTAEHVMALVEAGQAACLMGNHEYNLLAWALQLPGWERPKRSNGPTAEDVTARPQRWRPVLEGFAQLPLAVELPELRLIHATWHAPSLASLEAAGRTRLAQAEGVASGRVGALEAVRRGVRVPAVFEASGAARRPLAALGGLELAAGLHASGRGEPDAPHEVLMKGHERAEAEPFADADGHLRTEARVTWWTRPDPEVPRDRPIVMGHYWNLPPEYGVDAPHWAPPWPSGHPKLRAWWQELGPRLRPEGRVAWHGDVMCVDFNGYGRFLGDRACVGALRWPEREVVWSTAPLVTAEAGAPEPSWRPAAAPTGSA